MLLNVLREQQVVRTHDGNIHAETAALQTGNASLIAATYPGAVRRFATGWLSTLACMSLNLQRLVHKSPGHGQLRAWVLAIKRSNSTVADLAVRARCGHARKRSHQCQKDAQRPAGARVHGASQVGCYLARFHLHALERSGEHHDDADAAKGQAITNEHTQRSNDELTC
jgi:hypothetical protein